MNKEEAVRKLEYSKTAYQMLIDEKVDSGKLVGKDVKGEWKADTPLDEAYKSMIEALEMGIKAIKALEQQPCGNAIDRAEAIKIASGYCHPANVANELAKLPSVNPQPCEDAISRQAVLDMATTIQTDDYSGNEIIEVVDVDDVKALPPVTPQPKTGHWIPRQEIIRVDKEGNEMSATVGYKCSKCLIVHPRTSIYCPSCGAKMIEPQGI